MIKISLSSAKLGERWLAPFVERPNWIRFAAYHRPGLVQMSEKLPCMHGFQPSRKGRIAAGTLTRRGKRGSSCAVKVMSVCGGSVEVHGS